MFEKKLSVIVPIYNCERYINKCVCSIVGQDYKNLEVILIDDGSSDRSAEICDSLKKENPCIRVIHQKNKGVSHARNVGMQIASGEYITFVDADDYLLDYSVYSEAVRVLENKKVDVVAWLWQYENMSGNKIVSRNNITGVKYGMQSARDFLKLLYCGNYANGMVISVWNKLYRTEKVKSLEFPMIYSEDDSWSVQVLAEASYIYVMNKFGYVYKENDKSLTHLEFTEKNYSILDILKKRNKLLQNDEFLMNETQKLYCNLYIEYFYRAREVDIEFYEDKITFNCYRKNPNLNIRTRIRFGIFSLSHQLYERYFWKG